MARVFRECRPGAVHRNSAGTKQRNRWCHCVLSNTAMPLPRTAVLHTCISPHCAHTSQCSSMLGRTRCRTTEGHGSEQGHRRKLLRRCLCCCGHCFGLRCRWDATWSGTASGNPGAGASACTILRVLIGPDSDRCTRTLRQVTAAEAGTTGSCAVGGACGRHDTLL